MDQVHPPQPESALEYAFGHPWRWDPEKQLVNAPTFIDSWDFVTLPETTIGSSSNRRQYLWGNRYRQHGFYQACSRLAIIYRTFEMDSKQPIGPFAEGLKTRMNQACWNGFSIPILLKKPLSKSRESREQPTSFSNPMNINRGVASIEQARSILEYCNRYYYGSVRGMVLDRSIPDESLATRK